MFIGATYELQENRKKESLFGYQTIKIMERVLSHTKTTTTKQDDSHWDHRQVTHTVYDYFLHCEVNHKDTCQIPEDDFSEEVLSGIYKYLNV